MSELLAVRVYGVPVPQGRPRARAVRLPSGVTTARVYERVEDKDWKDTVRIQVLAHRPPWPVVSALSMRLTFYLPRPKSLPKRERHPTRKPDLDNLAKAIKDALRGIVYRDDSQVVNLRAAKMYAVYDEAPGVAIVVEEL